MKPMACNYCRKEHGKPTESYCPERTYAYQKGLGFGVGRVKAWKLFKKMMTLGLEIN